MKEEFKDVINSLVKPLLKKEGYKKKALTFYKTKEELVYVINFQKSHGNYHSELGFYINCGIYCNDIASVLEHELIEHPKEASCHYRNRIESISDKAASKFLITPKTNLTKLKNQLHQSLLDVLKFYKQDATNLEEIILLMSMGNVAYDSFQIFRYCIRKKLPELAKKILSHRKKHIIASRWEEKHRPFFLKVLEEEKSAFTFKELDFEQRTALDAQETKILESNEKSGKWGVKEQELEHAILKFRQCLSIIPEPKTVFSESTRIYTQLGISYLLNKEYAKAKEAFQFAQKCPNPDLKELDELIHKCK